MDTTIIMEPALSMIDKISKALSALINNKKDCKVLKEAIRVC